MKSFPACGYNTQLTAESYCEHVPCFVSPFLNVAQPIEVGVGIAIACELWIVCVCLRRSGGRAADPSLRPLVAGFALLGVAFTSGSIEMAFAVPLRCFGRWYCLEHSLLSGVALVGFTTGLALCAMGAAHRTLDVTWCRSAPQRREWLRNGASRYVLVVSALSVLLVVGAFTLPQAAPLRYATVTLTVTRHASAGGSPGLRHRYTHRYTHRHT